MVESGGTHGRLNLRVQLQTAMRPWLFPPEASGLADKGLGLAIKYCHVYNHVLSSPSPQTLLEA